MIVVWEGCSLKLFKACPILTHRTVRSQRNRKCPRGPNRTTATLFAIKRGREATVLGLACTAFPVKHGYFSRYGKKSRNVTWVFLSLTEKETAESKRLVRFKSKDWLVTGYMLHTHTQKKSNIIFLVWTPTKVAGAITSKWQMVLSVWGQKADQNQTTNHRAWLMFIGNSDQRCKYCRDARALLRYILMLWHVNNHGHNN